MHKGRMIGLTLATLGMALVGGSLQASAAESPAGVAKTVAAAPGMSPAPERATYIGRYDFYDYNCPSGRACLAVWNQAGSNWRVFDMYACRTYYLSNAYTGAIKNKQTGGALVSMYGASGNFLYAFGTDTEPEPRSVNLEPVYSVRPC
jgi:hypothetical protein